MGHFYFTASYQDSPQRQISKMTRSQAKSYCEQYKHLLFPFLCVLVVGGFCLYDSCQNTTYTPGNSSGSFYEDLGHVTVTRFNQAAKTKAPIVKPEPCDPNWSKGGQSIGDALKCRLAGASKS